MMQMDPYLSLIRKVLTEGEQRKNERTGVGTLSVFGGILEFDLRRRFPLLQHKETKWATAFKEMLWFLSGKCDTTEGLNAMGSKLWDPWADHNGNLGPIYGTSWRTWGAKAKTVKQPIPKLRDGVKPTYLGVANGNGKEGHPLAKTWEGMIARCYDPKSTSYKTYGQKGVAVCDAWLEFEKFAADAVNLPGFVVPGGTGRKVLDKDSLGSGFLYSPEGCCWLTDAENAALKAEWVYTVEKHGEKYTFTNVTQFCEDHGVEAKNFSDLWTGAKNAKVRGGFTFVGKEPIRKVVDQVKDAIATIKTDPQSRRILVSAWNVGELRSMALPPCHWAHQLYVSNDGFLDMMVHQRSWDLMLGAPFNIAQYALLLHLYARATGKTARMLKFTYGDAHIYENHIEAANIMDNAMLAHEKDEDNACLHIVSANTDIDGFKIEDFHIEGYDPCPHIPLPVAV